MAPTLQQVYDLARGYLADLQVAGGESWPNAKLLPHLTIAAKEMQDAAGSMQLPRAEREIYLNLPANTSRLIPAAFGLTDLFEPRFVSDRSISSSVDIVSTDTGAPIQVLTAAPHGIADGAEAIVSQVAGTNAPLGRWLVSVIDATNVLLNGSSSDGLAGSGGSLSTATEDWSDLAAPDSLQDRTPNDGSLGEYVWKNGYFEFPGSLQARQLRIGYIASAIIPSLPNQPMGMDNCESYLACRTAGLASNSVREFTFADRLNRTALGPKMEADGSGGLLRSFVSSQVINMQRTQIRRGPFRARRVLTPFGYY